MLYALTVWACFALQGPDDQTPICAHFKANVEFASAAECEAAAKANPVIMVEGRLPFNVLSHECKKLQDA